MSSPYSKAFFDGHRDGSMLSARNVIPEVLKAFQVRSVLDVGCGIGTWLCEFDRLGVKNYLGIDGEYVDQRQLLIPGDRFKSANLENPFDFGRFDLVCSMEVAEHLSESAADGFVRSLVNAAPVVLFSAAIPRQGGTDHINEQWQSYWAAKFFERGYVALDFIRPLIKSNHDVAFWYRQNTLVYCRPDMVPVGLSPVKVDTVDLVLPEVYRTAIAAIAAAENPSGRVAIRGLVGVLKRRVTGSSR